MRILIALLLIASSSVAYGQQIILIKAGKLFDSSQKKFLVNQQILVEGNKVTQVGTNLTVPPDAKIVDLTNYTVLPGLIDSHMHLFYLEPLKADITLENMKMITMEGDALRTLRAYKRGKTFLDAGITTIKELGNSGRYLDVALRTAIAEGTVVGPRIFASGPIISSVGGQLPGMNIRYDHMISEEYRIVKSVEDAQLAVREAINYGADLIKICADNAPNNTTLSIDQMRAIVQTAHRYNKKVTAHAVSERTVWEAVTAGVDGIEHGYSLSDSTARLMAKKGVYFVPTDISNVLLSKIDAGEGAKQWKAAQNNRLKIAMNSKVKIVAGSDNYIDFGMPQGDAAKDVLVSYHEAGMSPIDILTAATRTAAEFLGLTDKLGVIKKDALADIVAVEGDLEKEFPKAIYQIKFVMANGAIYKDVK
jgi:imidazolonepropionase-like amidohydrolase